MKFWNVIITSKEWKFREHAKTNGHTETAFFFQNAACECLHHLWFIKNHTKLELVSETLSSQNITAPTDLQNHMTAYAL